MWLVLAFLSAASLGFYDVFKKMSLRENAVIPVLFLNTLFCACIFLPLIVGSASGLIEPGSQGYIPTYGWAEHRFILLKSLIVLSPGYSDISESSICRLRWRGLLMLPVRL